MNEIITKESFDQRKARRNRRNRDNPLMCSHDYEYPVWEYDAQGIELFKACDICRAAKLAQYRPEILTGYDQSDVDERIEPDDPSNEAYGLIYPED